METDISMLMCISSVIVTDTLDDTVMLILQKDDDIAGGGACHKMFYILFYYVVFDYIWFYVENAYVGAHRNKGKGWRVAKRKLR